MKKLLLTILFLGICCRANAFEITSLSGDLTHGENIVISDSGSGFGTKSTAAPLIWDDVETGAFSGSWTTVVGLDVNADNARSTNSSYNAHLDFKSGDDDGYLIGGSDSASWFCQYWFKISSNWDWGNSTYGNGDNFLSNIKMFRMWSTSSINENFVAQYNGWRDSYRGALDFNAENIASPNNPADINNIPALYTTDTWHCCQFEFKDNSALEATDGSFKMWVDGVLKTSSTTLKTREDFSQNKRPFILGWSNVWSVDGGEDDEDPNDFYMDDMYIDNSWARVEIGDNIKYEDCTHREIQIPSAWAAGEVTAEVNQGSFADSSTVYIWVIDSNGIPSDQDAGTDGYQGYEATLNGAGGGDTSPPYISGRNPASGATNVLTTTDIVFHVLDAGVGVDSATITCTAEGTSETGDLTITGTGADYTCTLANADIDASMDYDRVIDVVVNADDDNANSMTQVSYSFTLESEDAPVSANKLRINVGCPAQIGCPVQL